MDKINPYLVKIAFYDNGNFIAETLIPSMTSQSYRDEIAEYVGAGNCNRQILDDGKIIIRRIKPNFIKIRNIPGSSGSRVICYDS